jgi:hypothetical protein
MNPAYEEVIASSDADRGTLFAEAAVRLGTAVQNVEKDFWVCWTLDALFNGLEAGSPRLLFKGGTSLSKAFTLIPRFSEDIDITVFREDIGQTTDAATLDALSGKKRRIRLDAIREACQTYINGSLATQLRQHAKEIGKGRMKLEPDPDDSDKQKRTFWDKIIILHGLRQWHDRRGVLRHGGQRVSRHYYDIHQLMRHNRAHQWLENRVLAADCATHARLFFGSADLGLTTAMHGSFTLTPPPAMREALKVDYIAMAGMIFGDVPSLDAILETIAKVELRVNS